MSTTVTVEESNLDVTVTVSNERGAIGPSAYQIAVSNGFEGTEAEWLASLVGTTTVDGLTDASTDGKAIAKAPGPYSSVVAAAVAGVALEDYFIASDGKLTRARPILSRVAICGDSLMVGGANRAGALYGGFGTFLAQHSDYAILPEYPDVSRDASVHAEGGYASSRAPLAAAEVVATCRPAPEAAIIQYGHNDITTLVPSGTYVANMAAAVEILQAAGVYPIVLLIPPGDATRAAQVAAFNAALIAEFGDRNDVRLIDCRATLEQSAGLAKSFYLIDDKHLAANATRLWVRDIIDQLGNWVGPPRNMLRSGVPVNKNPFFKTNSSGIRTLTGGTNTVDAYVLRDDGRQYLGEKWITIAINHGNPRIGTAATNAVDYVLKVPGTEAYAEHYADAAANATLTVEMRSKNTLRVNLRRSANFVILSTPAEIEAAVNAFGASPYTATANGASVAAYGQMPSGGYWTALEAGDAKLYRGDQVRAILEILPVPGETFSVREIGCVLYAQSVQFGAINTNINYFSELSLPLEEGESLTLVGAWATVATVDATTNEALTPAVMVNYWGHGKFRLARIMLQKKANVFVSP